MKKCIFIGGRIDKYSFGFEGSSNKSFDSRAKTSWIWKMLHFVSGWRNTQTRSVLLQNGLVIHISFCFIIILISLFCSYEDVKVYFHRNGQFLDLSGRMGYKIYVKDKVQSQVIWHDIRSKSINYHWCFLFKCNFFQNDVKRQRWRKDLYRLRIRSMYVFSLDTSHEIQHSFGKWMYCTLGYERNWGRHQNL